MTTRRQFFIQSLRASETDLSYLEQVDPSGKRWNWILRGRREGWFANVPVPEIQQALERFNRLSKSPRFKEVYHPDINSYTWKALGEALQKETELKSNKQRAREFEGAELMWSDDDFAVYKVLTPKGAELAGSGSSWCTTASEDTAKSYLQDGHLYIVHLWGAPYTQFHPIRREWNLAANIVTRQCIFDTVVWMDHIGYQALENAGKARQDKELLNALYAHPIIRVDSPGDSKISAILNPLHRVTKATEQQLIRSSDLPKGYFRRLRKVRDSELETFLGSYGTPETCYDYVECVSNNVPPEMVARIRRVHCYHARYINRTEAATFQFSIDNLDLFRHWMAESPHQFNPSCIPLLRHTSSTYVRNYFKRCKQSDQRYHNYLISRSQLPGEDIEDLYLYEDEVLGGVQPRTLERLLQRANDPGLVINNERSEYETQAKVWMTRPELRSKFNLTNFHILRFLSVKLATQDKDFEEAICKLSPSFDFDYGEFRRYVSEVAVPIVSDKAVLNMVSRRRGNSVSFNAIFDYLGRYPAGLEKETFLLRLFEEGLRYRNADYVKYAFTKGTCLKSRQIAAIFIGSEGVSHTYWNFITHNIIASDLLAVVALRLHRAGLTCVDWDVCSRWRVSQHIRRLMPPRSPSSQTNISV